MEIHTSHILIFGIPSFILFLWTLDLSNKMEKRIRELRQEILISKKVLGEEIDEVSYKVECHDKKIQWHDKKVGEIVLSDSLDLETGRSTSLVTDEYYFLEQLIKTLIEDLFSLSGSPENVIKFRGELTKIILFDSQPLSAAKRNMNLQDVLDEITCKTSIQIEMLFAESRTPPQISELMSEIVKRVISLYFSMMTLDHSCSLWIEPSGTAFDLKRHRVLSDDNITNSKISYLLMPGLSIFAKGKERVIVKALVVTN